jgi:type II secretory pathway pseudopilin PulG
MERGAASGSAPFFLPRKIRGWTLMELVVVLVVSSIIVYFVVRAFQPKDAVALQQAEQLRDDVRHIQMLAITWSEALRITTVAVAGGVPARYSVSCVSGSATAPCNGAGAVNDPATGRVYSVDLEDGLDLAGPGFSLDLDALGRPKNGAAFISANATFTITGGSVARTVVVQPLTGFASAQ